MQSFNSNYVDALRYTGTQFTVDIDLTEEEVVNIFVPSLGLDFTKDSACKVKEPFTSVQASQVVRKQYKIWREQNYNFTQEELDIVRRKADSETQEKVLVPLQLAEELNSLVERNQNNPNSKELDREISNLAANLFSKVLLKK